MQPRRALCNPWHSLLLAFSVVQCDYPDLTCLLGLLLLFACSSCSLCDWCHVNMVTVAQLLHPFALSCYSLYQYFYQVLMAMMAYTLTQPRPPLGTWPKYIFQSHISGRAIRLVLNNGNLFRLDV